MWKRLSDFILNALSIIQRQERQEKRQKDQEEEVKRLTNMVTVLAHELQRTQDQLQNLSERESYERKILLQEIEIRLLKDKLQLPPQSEKGGNKNDEDGK